MFKFGGPLDSCAFANLFCSCTQSELQDLFGRVGKVQSVIINKEKRHAFVKMLTREGAVVAKETMGEYKSGGLALRVSTHTTILRGCSPRRKLLSTCY